MMRYPRKGEMDVCQKKSGRSQHANGTQMDKITRTEKTNWTAEKGALPAFIYCTRLGFVNLCPKFFRRDKHEKQSNVPASWYSVREVFTVSASVKAPAVEFSQVGQY